MRTTLLAILLFVLANGAARADLIYRFEQPSYTVNVGQTVDVRVFLEQTAPTTTLTTDGLFSAGVRVNWTGGVRVMGTADIIPNPVFDDAASLVKEVNPGTAGLSEAVDLLSGGFPVMGASILIGTFQFTAGQNNRVSSLTATDFTQFDETISGQGLPLDAQISPATAIINVVGGQNNVAVPEPTTLALVGAGLLGLWSARRPRRSH